MADQNKYIASGIVDRAPEIKTSAKGNPYARLSLTVTEDNDKRSFIPFMVFDEDAIKAVSELPENARVEVEAYVSMRKGQSGFYEPQLIAYRITSAGQGEHPAVEAVKKVFPGAKERGGWR